MHLRRLAAWGLCLALAAPAVLSAQEGMGNAKPSANAPQVPPAQSLNALLSMIESEVVGAAEAMPAEKYDFAPPATMGLYTGVRTFSAQVKHLTESNYSFFRGWGVPGGMDRKAIEALKTKEDIVDALKKSYAYAHAAVDTITPGNAFQALPGPPQRKMTRVSTAAFAMAHSMDHYGQMVEYLRMNGIVPPASRRPESR